jgi:hypothetical protein
LEIDNRLNDTDHVFTPKTDNKRALQVDEPAQPVRTKEDLELDKIMDNTPINGIGLDKKGVKVTFMRKQNDTEF